MPRIAEWMDRAVTAAGQGDDTTIDAVAAEVAEFLAGYPMPGWA
jgi:glycine hydroxymethyltransferase